MDMQFTTRTQEALTSAMQLAAANGNPEVTSAHILLALLQQGDDGIAAALLEAVGSDRTALLGKTRELVAKLPSATGGASPQLSRDGLAAVQTAQDFAQERGDEYVSTEHLLIGIAASAPNALPTATARLSSTTGDGIACASTAYSAAIRAQSVSSACRARA